MLPMALITSTFICPTSAKTIHKEALSVSTSTYLGKGRVNFLCQKLLILLLFLIFNHSFVLVSSGAPHLSSQGTIQDKITVCATNDSYQVTKVRVTKAEEDKSKNSTKFLKPGGPFRGLIFIQCIYISCNMHTQMHSGHLDKGTTQYYINPKLKMTQG